MELVEVLLQGSTNTALTSYFEYLLDYKMSEEGKTETPPAEEEEVAKEETEEQKEEGEEVEKNMENLTLDEGETKKEEEEEIGTSKIKSLQRKN